MNRILIVDDEEKLRHILQLMLERQGFVQRSPPMARKRYSS